MATRTKAVSLSIVRSYDLDSRRERLSQPNVRSTIQRFGWTSNRPAARATISTHQAQRTQAQRARDLYAVSAQMTFGNFTDSRNADSANLPPSRSCVHAGVTTSAQTRPSVSTTTWRLRPTTFFPPVVAAEAALFGRLDGLAVEDRRRRFGRLARFLADALAQGIVYALPRTVRLPLAKPVKYAAEGRQIMRQSAPSAAVSRDIEDGVDDFALGIRRRPTSRGGLRHPGLDPLPLRIRQIGGVGLPAHAEERSILRSYLQ